MTDNISVLNSSRMARISYEYTKEHFKKHKEELLKVLLSHMRNGAVDPQVYAKYLGGIQALDDLESFFKKEILKGEKIETELLNESGKPSRS